MESWRAEKTNERAAIWSVSVSEFVSPTLHHSNTRILHPSVRFPICRFGVSRRGTSGSDDVDVVTGERRRVVPDAGTEVHGTRGGISDRGREEHGARAGKDWGVGRGVCDGECVGGHGIEGGGREKC